MSVTTAADLLVEAELLCREMRTCGLPVTPDLWAAVDNACRHALAQVAALPLSDPSGRNDLRTAMALEGLPTPEAGRGAEVSADDPCTLPRLAMVLSTFGDLLTHEPDWFPQPVPADDQAETARRILTITAVTARQTIATGRLEDCLRPFEVGRQAERMLDILGAPGAFPRSLDRFHAVVAGPIPVGGVGLLEAAVLWDSAFRDEMARSVVPSLDTLRSLVNTGRHAYAVAAQVTSLTGGDRVDEQLAALVAGSRAFGQIEQNWPKAATTLVRPGHAFIGASRDLYTALAAVQKGVAEKDPALDLEAASLATNRFVALASARLQETWRLPERLLKSGLIFAPAASLRATTARLPAVAKRRFTAADIDDYGAWIGTWDRTAQPSNGRSDAARLAVRTVPAQSHSML